MFHVAICEVSGADPAYRDDPWCSHDWVYSFADRTRKIIYRTLRNQVLIQQRTGIDLEINRNLHHSEHLGG